MKRVVILICCSLLMIGLQAQTFQWASSAGPSKKDYPTDAFSDRIVDMCTDSDGNVYIGVDVDGYTGVMLGDSVVDLPLTEIGVGCAVLCYDCNGELQWYKFFFGKSPSNSASIPTVSLGSVNLINDTVLLLGIGSNTISLLMVVNEKGEIDTLQDKSYKMLLWMNRETQEWIKTQNEIYPNVVVSNNGLYVKNWRTIIMYDMAGEERSQTTVDIGLVREDNRIPDVLAWTVHEGRYYMLLSSTYSNIIGGDTLGVGSYVACFDKSGSNVWYRKWENSYIRGDMAIDIDTTYGTLYIAQGSRFVAYNLEGALLFDRRIGNGTLWGMKVLSHHRVAMGGNADGYVSAGGVDNDTIGGPFFFLYDGNVDKFMLCQRATSGVFTHFCVDKDDNLLFGGIITNGMTSILGDDTIRCRSSRRNTFFGKYGWPCGEAAQWPDAVGIEGVSSAAPQALTVYPNPTSDGVWVERFGTDAAALPGNAESARLVLRGSMGRQVAQHTLPAGTSRYYLPMAHLPQGIYLLEYHPQGQPPIVKKIVKVRRD